jgi:hypothetical protein
MDHSVRADALLCHAWKAFHEKFPAELLVQVSGRLTLYLVNAFHDEGIARISLSGVGMKFPWNYRRIQSFLANHPDSGVRWPLYCYFVPSFQMLSQRRCE